MNRDNSYLIGNSFAKGQGANKGSFKKGCEPWNKNTKGVMKVNSGSFKKGQPGRNKLPIGSTTIRKTKKGVYRRFIKIASPNKWIEFARFTWVKHNGEIPRGYLIHHIDEDPLNDRIDNLTVLNREGHFRIHNIMELGRNARAEKLNR